MQNLKIKIKSGNAKFKNGKHKTGHFAFQIVILIFDIYIFNFTSGRGCISPGR